MDALYDDADLYGALLPASPGQLNYYSNLAREQAGRVLALACGSGQVIVPIAARGLRATGLDRSAAMLAAAGRRAIRAGTEVELVEGDMRDFELGRRFSLTSSIRASRCSPGRARSASTS